MTGARLLGRRSPTLSLLALAVCGGLHAQVAPTQSDWGGTGLMQTPVARMADDGELSFVASHTSPYSRYSISLQPFPWLEASFRYVNVAGVAYGQEWLSGDQNYKDKSVDFKLRLLKERRWWPELALGMRDIGGTGFFSSEYLVASKRFGTLDASLGLATGYLGSNGDFDNPLGWIDDRFDTRPGNQGAGQFNANAMFRGPVGVFGGVAWQTPWHRWLVKLEYDGHDYDQEPRVKRLPQDSRLNVGVQYSVTPGLKLALGWERGNELMAALTFRGNLARAQRLPRLLDPPKETLRESAGRPTSLVAHPAMPAPAATEPSVVADAPSDRPDVLRSGESWGDVARRLNDNAGISVQDIGAGDREVIVRGEQWRFFYPAEGLGRAARILANATGPDVDWFTIEHARAGMPISQSSVSRDALAAYARGDIDLATLSRHVELNRPGSSREAAPVYEAPLDRFTSGFSPGYGQFMGGPDAFILYQVSVNWTANFRFSRSTWLSGTVSANLLNNFDKFRYDAPSNLPRVRTDLRLYATTEDITIPNLQLTSVRALGPDLFGMAYAGLFESMYGGVGGELLYRPFGERWAAGVEANWVQQRDYDQRFDFRNYRIATGHATLYYGFGREQQVQTALSAGRYLAGDWGATLSIGRAFANGVTMGAYATKTDVSSQEFGEGSFDKGIYVSVPTDLLLPRSSRGRANLMWNPLIRDGGARLARAYGLYPLTGERNREFFYDNVGYIDP
ncbi:MAG TPA: YjbH domain-containing protein [Stenotrophomonas sp.]|jgi:hypothetical protein